MMMQEFKKRTEKFLADDEISKYADNYEPAYMAAQTVDKDDFCAILKDERVRRVICGVSAELRKLEAELRSSTETIRMLNASRAESNAKHAEELLVERGKVEVLFKQLSLVQAVCDRALATK